MKQNTFERIGENKILEFLEQIAFTNPDYVVPVKKKGCKLLRHFLSENGRYKFRIRYIDYFRNNNVDVRNLNVAIVDDATKYTSMLYKYRKFFEERGATVFTYSFVGQSMLKEGKREMYDQRAYIYTYLDEPTYQEYILQQAQTLSADDSIFDIDHLVIQTSMSVERYKEFVCQLYRIGDVVFANDLYTPSYIDKVSVIDIKYVGAEQFYPIGVEQGVLQKIRLAYNSKKAKLLIAPLSFPVWDTTKAFGRNLFDNIPFLVPNSYEDKEIPLDGIFFNIVFTFQMYLLKYFIDTYNDFSELQSFEFIDVDMNAFIGEERTKKLLISCYDFLHSDVRRCYEARESFNTSIIVKGTKAFHTIKDIMDELRYEYEKRIKTQGFLNAYYYLSFEEILKRYDGTANVLKWIDILCDRGVMVTRNISNRGIYYRACRSGEANYDQREERTNVLVAFAINCCGEKRSLEDKSAYAINATYLNKVLANLVYDYPVEDFDFHYLFTEPDYYGPYTYIKNGLGGDNRLPLHMIDSINPYCYYLPDNRHYYAERMDEGCLSEKFQQLFGVKDSVSIIEITSYLEFLKIFREYVGTDKYLNELAICRERNTYYRYVYHNLNTAFMNLKAIIQHQEHRWSIDYEPYLRRAGQHAKSAKEKLEYDQKEILDLLNHLSTPWVYRQVHKKIVDSFEPFDKEFLDEEIPKLQEIQNNEYVFINLKLYTVTFDPVYWKRFYKAYLKIDNKIVPVDAFDRVYGEYSKESRWSDEALSELFELANMVLSNCMKTINEIFSKLDKPTGQQYLDKKKREHNIQSTNRAITYIMNYNYKSLAFLYYTYSGFKNEDVLQGVNVVQEIQEYIAHKLQGKLLYGATGGYEDGLLLVEKVEDAISFAIDFINWVSNIGKIDIRFGCSYRPQKEKAQFGNIDYIKKAILEAQNLGTKILRGNSFIINEQSYEEIRETELSSEFYDIVIEGKNYYENKDVRKMSNDFIYNTETDDSIRIGIITVLDEEYEAMKYMLSNTRMGSFRGTGTGNRFLLGDINAFGGEKHTVVLTRTLGDGNNKAAIRAQKLLYRYPKLDVIFMVGIAGGIPLMPNEKGFFDKDEIKEKHVRLGDVVIANGVIQYDYIKEKIEEVVTKGNTIPPSAEVLEAVQLLNSEESINGSRSMIWNRYIASAISTKLHDFSRPNSETDILHDLEGNVISHPDDDTREKDLPRVFIGKIASANRVLKNPLKRAELKKEHNVMAVEMETSGIADCTWESAKSYFAIRGVCDYCDESKNNTWHNYAALVAAAYTRAVIEQLQR